MCRDEFVGYNPGPLMPVTLAQANNAITAQRDMTYDFTNVTFTKQVANIAEQGNIEIIDQNYQFDLEGGVNSVELELDAERYYMIVRVLH